MKVLVVGAGKVGSALSLIVSRCHKVTVLDIEAINCDSEHFDVMHVCFPFNDCFVWNVKRYIHKFTPELTIIESTVPVGTTREIWLDLHRMYLVVHSPVRGLHDALVEGLEVYDKFIGAPNDYCGHAAYNYYRGLGLYPFVCDGPEETEFSKLANLSYFAVQVAFWQEIERKVKSLELNLSEVQAFFKSTGRDRPVRRGGVIGGECVMQGLIKLFSGEQMFNWVCLSNEARKSEV